MDLAASRAPSKTRPEDRHQRGPVNIRWEKVEVDGVIHQRRHLPSMRWTIAMVICSRAGAEISAHRPKSMTHRRPR